MTFLVFFFVVVFVCLFKCFSDSTQVLVPTGLFDLKLLESLISKYSSIQ